MLQSLTPVANASDANWLGTSGTNWSTAGNWSATVPGAGNTATFNSSGNSNTKINVDSGISLGSVKFDLAAFNGATGYDIIGNGIILSATGSIMILPTFTGVGITETIENLLTLSGSYTFANMTPTTSNDVLLFKGNITNNTASTLNLSGSGAGTISGNILAGSGTQSLSVSGGLWTLSGSNSFTGNTTISSGTLQLSGAAVLSGSTSNLIDSGGVLNLGATSQTLGAVTIAGGTIQNGTLTGSGYTSTGGTVNAILAGGGVLTLNSGLLVLGGSNTYSGGTTINSGTLQLGNGITTGYVATNVTDNGTLAFSSTGNQTFGKIVSGTGGLLSLGSGTVSLTAANTYTGSTTVNGGTLKLDFSQAGAPASNIINSSTTASTLNMGGGTLAMVGGTAAATQQFKGMNVNVGASSIQFSGTNPLLLALGAITHNAGGTVDFTLPAGVQSVSNGITTTSSNTINGIFGGWATVGGTTWATYSAGNIVSFASYGTDYVGATGTTNFDATSSGTFTPTSINSLRFNSGSGGGVTTTLSGSFNIVSGGILVTSTVGSNPSVITGGNSLTSGTGELIVLQNNTSGPLTIYTPIVNNGATPVGLTLSGSGTLILNTDNTYTGKTTINGGILQLGDGFTNGSISSTSTIVTNATLAIDNGLDQTVDNKITGSGGVTIAGAGMVTLTATNTYTGLLTLNSGVLYAAMANINGNDVTNGIAFNGGSLLANGTISTGKAIFVNFGGGIFDTNGTNSTFSGSFSGPGMLTKNGLGTLTLNGPASGANFYGGLTLNSGTLQLNESGSRIATIGSLTINGGVLDLASNIQTVGPVTFTNSTVIQSGTLTSTSGGFTSLGGGTVTAVLAGAGEPLLLDIDPFGNPGVLTLSGSNTYSGGTTINSGTLQISGIGTLGATNGSLAVSNGLLDLGGTNQTVGAVTIGATDTYGAITQGTIQNGKLTGTGFTSNGGGLVSAVLIGTNAQLIQNSGTLTLSASNAYTGQTTVNNGLLQIGTTGGLGTGNLVMNGGVLDLGSTKESVTYVTITGGTIQSGTLSASNTTTVTGGGVINASLIGTTGIAVTMGTGGGVLTLGGSNGNTGSTTLTSGTIQINSPGTLGATTAGLNVNGGVLDLGATKQTVAAVTIGGGTIQNGTLTGNSYTSTGGSVSAGLAGSGALTLTLGTLTLSGSNSYTGTTTVKAGNLVLDYTSSNTNKIASGVALTLGSTQGGNLQMIGNNSAPTSQAVSGLTLSAGANGITVVSGSNQNTNLRLNTISRSSAGSTLDFGLVNVGTGVASITDTGNSLTNNILTISSVAFATVGQQYWATVLSGSSIVPLTTGTGTLFGAANNVTLASGTTTLASGTSANTLRINSASTLNLQNNTLTLTSGGILVTNNVSAPSVISSGTLISSGGELAIHQFSASPLTISSALSAPGALTLTKSGTGTLILSGNNSGLTGTVYLNLGTIQAGSTNAIGNGSNTLQMGDGSSVFDLHGNNISLGKLTTDTIYASYGTSAAQSGQAATITNTLPGTLATLTVGSGANASTFAGGFTEASGAILSIATAGTGNFGIGNPAFVANLWSNRISGAITIAAGSTLTANITDLLTTGALTISGTLGKNYQAQIVEASYLAGTGALSGSNVQGGPSLQINHVGSVPDSYNGTMGTGPGFGTSTTYSFSNNGTGTVVLPMFYYGAYFGGLYGNGTGMISTPGMVTGTAAPYGRITVGGIGTVKLTGGTGSTAATPTTVMPQGAYGQPAVALNGGTLWVAPTGSGAAAYVNNGGQGGIYANGGGTLLLDSGSFSGLTLTLGSGSAALLTRSFSYSNGCPIGGTLVIGAAHGLSALGGTEKLNFISTGTSALPVQQNGIVAPWVVGQDANPASATYTNGSFLTYVGTGAGSTGQAGTDTGFQPFVSSSNNTNFATTSTNTTVELVNTPVTLSGTTTVPYMVYALQVDPGGVLTLGGIGGMSNTLMVGSGSNQAGIILNGGVITGPGSINYGTPFGVIGELTVYTSLAGGRIDTSIINSDGVGNLIKFGPGTLTLNGNNGTANMTLNSGVLDISGMANSSWTGSAYLNLRGGVLQSNDSVMSNGFSGLLSWGAAGGGFAARGGALTIAIGGQSTLTNLVWGNGGNFVPEGGVLMFGSTTADNPVTVLNNIDLGNAASAGGYSRVINVQGNSIDAIRDPLRVSDKAIISGTISSTNPYHGLAKDGNGVLVLLGSNTYTGATSIANGTLLVASDAGLGTAPTAPYALNTTPGFSGGTMTPGALVINGGANFGIYSTGTAAQTLALSPNRTILLASGTAGTTPGNILLDNLTTLQFGGQIANYINEIGALGKQGPGTLVLFGSNTYTGSTTAGNGTLRLDFTQPGAPAANIINGATNSSSLLLGGNARSVGGTLSILGSSGTSNSQRFNGLTVGAGASAIQLTSSNNALLLNPGAITRNVGGTIDFTLPAGVQSGSNGILTSLANSNGILSGWATVSGSTWAVNSSGNIAGLTGAGYGNLYASATGTTNFDATGSGTFTPTSINSLRFNSSAAVTGTLNGAFSIGSGGILVTSATGANPSTITGGSSLTSGTSDLIVIQNNIANPLTIRTPIVGSIGLTLSGSGTTILSGASTYNGVTTINGGTLQLGDATADSSLLSSGIVDNGMLVYYNTNTQSFANGISGIGGFTKQGAGTLTLSGSNTYNGVLTLTSGTLVAATAAINGGDWSNGIVFNGGILKAAAGGITTAKPVSLLVPGTFDVGTTTSALLGFISGPGSLTMLGSGTLTLAAGGNLFAAPFSGGLNINGGGTVQCSGPSWSMLGSGNITFGGASTLDLKDCNPITGWLSGGASAVVTNSALDTATATLTLGGSDSQTFAGVIKDGNTAHVALVISGSGTQTLSGVNTYAGTTTINSGTVSIGADSGIGGTHGTATVLSSNQSSINVTLSSIPVGLTVGSVFLGRNVQAITSGSTLTLWGNASNTISTGTAVSYATDPTLTINGGALQATASFSLVISDTAYLTATQNRNIVLNGSSCIIDVTGANTLTVPGTISGAGGLTKTNTGTLLLMAGNSYSGATTIQNGTLKLGWPFAINNSLTLTIGQDGASNSAILDMGSGNYFSNVTVASLSSKGTALGNDWITNGSTITGTAGTATLTINPDLATIPVDSIFGGTIMDGSSPIALTKAGSHTLTLNGTNTYTGILTLNGGVLNATTASLNGGNTTKGIVINGATLQAGNGGISTAKTVNMLWWGTFDTNGNNSTLSGVISGSGGALTKWGAGSLTLAAANTFSGGLVINQGTIIDGYAGSTTLGTSSVSFGTSFSPTLDLNGNSPTVTALLGTGTNGIVTNNASGTGTATLTITGGVGAQNFGGVIQDGTSAHIALSINVSSGIQVLSGSNSYSGGTILNSGVLSLGNSGALGTSGTITFNGGILQFSAANTTDYSSRFSTAANQLYSFDTNGQNVTLAGNLVSTGINCSLNKWGAGTLVLSGTGNTLAGGLIINGGMVQDGNAASGTLGSGNVTLKPSSSPVILDLNGNSPTVGLLIGSDTNGIVTNSAIGSGTATLSLVGSGTQTFSGLIQDGGATARVGLSKGGTGTEYLTGTNTYTGSLTLNGGVLNAATANINGSNLNSGITFNGGTLQAAPGGIITAKPIVLSGSGGIDTNGNDSVFSGAMSGTGALTKSGFGTLTLNISGNKGNKYTGATVVNAGTLLLDFSNMSIPTNLLSGSSNLTLGGGVLRILGNSTTATGQTLGNLTLTANTGMSSIVLTPSNSMPVGLVLSSTWTRGTNTTLLVDMSAPGGSSLTASPALTGTDGILGYAVVKDSTGTTGFATVSGSGTIVRYKDETAGVNLTANSNDITTNFTTRNSTYTSGTLDWTGTTTRSVNSLIIDTTSKFGALNLGGTANILTLATGAILFKGGNAETVTGGQIGASGTEVIIHQVGTGTLTINSSISNGIAGTLTKDGSGTLVLNGTNSFGFLSLSGGILRTADAGLNSVGTNRAIIFNSGTLQVATGGISTLRTITLAGIGTIDTNGNTATLNGSITGSGGPLVKTGSGTLRLAGPANSFSAGMIINQGTVECGASAGLGTGNITFGASNTPMLDLHGYTTTSGALIGGTNAIVTSSTGNGTLSLNFNGAARTFAGTIQDGAAGTIGITKAGSGVEILTGTNTFTGAILLNGGILNATTANISGTSAGSITFNGGTLQAASGGINTSKGVTVNALGGTFDTNGNDSTLSGGIAGSTGALTKNGVGMLVVGGSGNFSGGLTINNGTVQITTSSVIGGGDLIFGVSNTPTLDLNGNNATVGSLIGASGNGVITNNAVYTGVVLTSTLTLSGARPQSFGGVIQDGTPLATAIALTVNGPGTQTLTGTTNTFTGQITLNGGVLNASTGGINGGDTTNGIAFNGGTLQAGSGGINTAKYVTIGMSGATFDTNGASSTLSGLVSGSGSFTTVGSGTLNLAGANTYTGPTNVAAGTLVVSGGITGAVTVGAAATLATGDKASTSTVGSLVVLSDNKGGGTLTPGVPGDPSLSGVGALNVILNGLPGDVTLGTASTAGKAHLAMKLGDTVAGISNDQVVMLPGSTLNLTNVRLDGSLINGFTANNFSYDSGSGQYLGDMFFLVIGATTINGTFANQLPADGNVPGFNTIIIGGQEFAISYTARFAGVGVTGLFSDVGGTDIALLAIPEPETWVLLLGGLGILGAWTRARRRHV